MALAKALSMEGWESTEDFEDVQTVEFDKEVTNAQLGDFLHQMADFIAAVPDDQDDASDFIDDALEEQLEEEDA